MFYVNKIVIICFTASVSLVGCTSELGTEYGRVQHLGSNVGSMVVHVYLVRVQKMAGHMELARQHQGLSYHHTGL
jgi:hypothetical protein